MMYWGEIWCLREKKDNIILRTETSMKGVIHELCMKYDSNIRVN